MLSVGSVCTGVGGLDLGLERAGMRVLWQCEADEKCRAVLARHWPGVPCYPDLRLLCRGSQPTGPRGGSTAGASGGSEPAGSLGGVEQQLCAGDSGRKGPGQGPERAPVDLLAGGFPCQDLSVAGARAGLAGERSALFFDLARVASVVLPPGAWLLVENVDGLLSSNRGRDFVIVLATLAELGFHDLAWRVLNSRYFGVPQRRRRVFILARRACGRGAAEVLLEPESGGGSFAPSGQAGARVAATLVRGSSRPGVSAPGRRQDDDENIVGALNTNAGGVDDNSARAGHVVGPLMRGNRGDDAEVAGGHFVPAEVGTLRTASHAIGLDTPERYPLVAGTLRSQPRNNSNGGTEARSLVATPDPDGAGAPSGLPGWLDDPLRPLACPAEPRPDGPREQQMGNAVTVPVAEWIGRRMIAHIEAERKAVAA